MDYPYFETGRFYTGCNYWASHAGVYMWRDWRPDIVKADFQRMEKAGLKLVRMFPLWPDFQPLQQQYGCAGEKVCYALHDRPLPDTWEGQCGVDADALEKLQFLLDCAAESHIGIMVGLLTGWMSGRLFVPPAFEGRNVITDAEVVKWEVRFVRCLVRRFKDHPAVKAWDLGNECNCMGASGNAANAWLWNNAIASAIRLEDDSRPVVSGMHGLSVKPTASWKPWDAGELNDIVNTHPYPLFTPGSSLSRVDTLRNAFHATAESRYYADLSGRPCTVEEAGNLGPMYSSQEIASNYLNNMLWNSYAHDCRSLLWWCAYDQSKLPFAPYEWNGMERQLGLFDANLNSTPVLETLGRFQKFLDGMAEQLPLYTREAVCILSHEQDGWAVAWSAFILAKQAGFDLEFQYADQPLKPAAHYILPAITGTEVIYRQRYHQLLDKVREGATLLVTWDGGTLQPFEDVFGVRPQWRSHGAAPRQIRLEGDATPVLVTQDYQLATTAPTARSLAVDQDGAPMMTVADYGKGKAFFLACSPEALTASAPKAFLPEAQALWKFYSLYASQAGISRLLVSNNPFITTTQHVSSTTDAIVIAVNNTPEALPFTPTLASGWTIEQVLHGDTAAIAPNSAVMLRLRRA